MTDVPLARAAFDFTLDEAVETSLRQALQAAALRAQRRRFTIAAGAAAAVASTLAIALRRARRRTQSRIQYGRATQALRDAVA